MLRWHYLIRLGLVAITHQSYLPHTSKTDSVGYSNIVTMMLKVYALTICFPLAEDLKYEKELKANVIVIFLH